MKKEKITDDTVEWYNKSTVNDRMKWYCESRVDDQIEWYCRKAAKNKRFHHWTKGGVIVASALIPLISGIDIEPTFKNVLFGSLGCLISIVAGLSALFKFEEKWSGYRTASETLKREKMFYATKAGPFENNSNPFKTLVTNVEGIIGNEVLTWGQYVREKNDGQTAGREQSYGDDEPQPPVTENVDQQKEE